MNTCCKVFTAVFLIFFAFIGRISAQNNSYVVGISGGTFIYQGDLVPGVLGSYRNLKPAIQLYGGKWLNSYFQLRATFSAGKIGAADADYTEPAWKQERNLRFQASVKELTARLVFSPFGDGTLIPDKRLYPYIFIGAGASFVNIKRDWSGISSSFLSNRKTASYLAADSAHSVPTVLLSVPFGAGISYVISPRLSLFGEAAYHLPVTDYLDGFSYLGNSKKKDNYYSINIGISYNLFRNGYTRCPRVKKQGLRFIK